MSTETAAAEQPKSEPIKKQNPSFEDVPSEDEKKLVNTKVFVFDYQSPEDSRRYVGQFTCRRLTLGAIGQAGVTKARLNGGLSVDRNTDMLHEMMSYLAVALIEVPDWWDPESSFDPNLLRSLYSYVRHWESNFRSGGVG